MPETIDYVAHLTQEVGPRPAGTEEEQQAALYIADQFEKEVGLPTEIEDFTGLPDANIPKIICCSLALLVTGASFFVPVIGIVSVIVTLATAILFAAEAFNRPLLSKFLSRSVSQNVVARYTPTYSPDSGSARRRKIVLVTKYDSGKVRPEVNQTTAKILPILQWVVLGAVVALPVLLLFKNVIFYNGSSGLILFFNILIGIALALLLLPLVKAVLAKTAAYNEGANCNASSNALLLEIAHRVNTSRASSPDVDEEGNIVIHGEDAAYAGGVVPEGAQLVYEVEGVNTPDIAPATPDARLSSAKAAIAALTGTPVAGAAPVFDISQNLVQIKEPPLPLPTDENLREMRVDAIEAFTPSSSSLETAIASNSSVDFEKDLLADVGIVGATTGASVGGAIVGAAASVAVTSTHAATYDDSSVPAWFKSAQQKAKKQREDEKPVQRSRYATALDSVETAEGLFAERVATEATPNLDKQFQHSSQVETLNAPLVAPLDLGDLSLDEVPSVAEPSIPSFLSSPAPCEDIELPVVEKELEMPSLDVSATPARVSYDMDTQAIPVEEIKARRPIVLPDVALDSAKAAPLSDYTKQRAPLADVENAGETAAKSLLTMLPSIDLGSGDVPQSESEDAQDSFTPHVPLRSNASLRSMLPSLSGAIAPLDAQDQGTPSVNLAGSFVAAGATGTFAPVGDELVRDVVPDEVYIDDADDSEYEDNFTELGAFAGPDYMEMPKSRGGRFFDRFRKKSKKETSAQEWLDIDEEFDAREVGAQRGGWESFRDEADGFDATTQFSAVGEGQNDVFDDYYDSDDRKNWNGGAFSFNQLSQSENGLDEIMEQELVADDHLVEEELKQVYAFRNASVNMEVWFVALGSELTQNSGMKAFLAEHQQDLRGAIIIELDGMGAGDLCLVETEGCYQTAKTSSRMKRYIKKASQASGVHVGNAKLAWQDSASSCAIKQGQQAMHLVGMDGTIPAFYGSKDDVFESVDEEILSSNADFVVELLKNI